MPPLSFFIPRFGVAVGVPRAYCRCGLDYLSSHLLMKFEITPAAIDKTKFIMVHTTTRPPFCCQYRERQHSYCIIFRQIMQYQSKH